MSAEPLPPPNPYPIHSIRPPRSVNCHVTRPLLRPRIPDHYHVSRTRTEAIPSAFTYRMCPLNVQNMPLQNCPSGLVPRPARGQLRHAKRMYAWGPWSKNTGAVNRDCTGKHSFFCNRYAGLLWGVCGCIRLMRMLSAGEGCGGLRRRMTLSWLSSTCSLSNVAADYGIWHSNTCGARIANHSCTWVL